MLRKQTLTPGGDAVPKPDSGVTKGLTATEPVLRKTPKTAERKKSLFPAASTVSGNSDRKTSIAQTEVSNSSRTSIAGLLASRRFSKRMFQKFHKEDPAAGTNASSTIAIPAIEREPTYKMEPDKKFNTKEVEEIIRKVISSTLNGMRYSPKLCCNIMKVLSEDIKKRVKDLDYPRYKIVCVMVLGEVKDQCAAVTSRCNWDPKFDSFATYTFKSNHLWCTGTVYGIYRE